MEGMQGQMTAPQQQVENLVESTIETSTAARCTQAVLKQADYRIQDLFVYLDGVA